MTKKTEGAEASIPFALKQALCGRAVFFRHHPPGYTHIRWEVEKDGGLEGANAAEILMPTTVFHAVAEDYLGRLLDNQPEAVVASLARALLAEPLAQMVAEWAQSQVAEWAQGRDSLKKTIDEIRRRRQAQQKTQDLPETD